MKKALAPFLKNLFHTRVSRPAGPWAAETRCNSNMGILQWQKNIMSISGAVARGGNLGNIPDLVGGEV